MQVLWKLIAVLALLLGAAFSAYGIEEQSATQQAQNDAKLIDLLFYAIFDTGDLEKQNITFNFPNIPIDAQSQICLDAFSVDDIQILSVGGFKMRQCVHITGWEMEQYIMTHNVAQLAENFSLKVAVCAEKDTSEAVTDCCAEAIADVFNTISSDGKANNPGNVQCFETELTQIFQQFNQATDQLMQCVQQ